MRPTVLLLSSLFGSARSDACTMPFVDFFTRYDTSSVVAEVEVTAIAKSGAVELRRLATLKGSETTALTARQGGMCPPSWQVGQKVVAFFEADGRGSWFEVAGAAAALSQWKAAKTDDARRALLAELSKSSDASVKLHATDRLKREEVRWDAADPAWKAPGTDKAATARLFALWPAIRAATRGNTSLARFDEAFTKRSCLAGASSLTARAAADRVRSTMGKAPDPSQLGSLAALEALGEQKVWNATCSLGFHSVFAYLTAADGALVMLWVPPEG